MNFRLYILIFLFFILQAFFLPALFPGYPVFNLALCFCLAAAFLGFGRKAVCVGFFLGVLLDFFSFTSVGISSLLLVFASFVALEVNQVFGSNIFVASLVCFLFSFLSRYFFSFFKISPWLFAGAGMDVALFVFFRYVLTEPVKTLLAVDDQDIVF